MTPSEGQYYEVVNGKRVEILPMSAYAGVLATRLATELNLYARGQKLGEAATETLFRLPLVEDQGRNRRPDVAFVSRERWSAAISQSATTNALDVVPDLVVEVVSPRNLADEINGKVLEYFRAGVRAVWVVWPRYHQVYVYESHDQITVLGDADTIEGGAVLPGFKFALVNLFNPGPPAETSALESD
jgi:Uma2 family endonuclease